MIFRFKYFSALISVALILSGVAPTANALPRGENNFGNCKKYVFMGLRGSGQNNFDSVKTKSAELRKMLLYYGPEISSLYLAIAEIPGIKGNIEFDTIDVEKGSDEYDKLVKENKIYEAAGFSFGPAYLDSVRTNATLSIVNQFSAKIRACGEGTKFIFAGYSQGAYGVHYLLSTVEKHHPELTSRILAAVLLADPSRPNKGLIPVLWDFNNSKTGKNFVTALMLYRTAAPAFDIAATLSKVVSGQAVANTVKGLTNQVKSLIKGEKPTQAFQDNFKKSINPITKVNTMTSQSFLDLLISAGAVNDQLTAPSIVPTFFYNSPNDIFADTRNVKGLEDTLYNFPDKIISMFQNNPISAIKNLKTIETGIDILGAIKTHSWYCPTSGVFSEKELGSKSGKCNAIAHNDFIDRSIEFVKSQVNSQKSIDFWFGKGWVGSTTNCGIIEKIFKNSTNDFKKSVVEEGWGVIAINPTEDAALLYTVSRGSGDPLAFMYQGNRLDESKYKLVTGVFYERGGTPGALYQIFDNKEYIYWTQKYLHLKNNQVVCKPLNN